MRIIVPVRDPNAVTAAYNVWYRFGLHRGTDMINASDPRDRTLVAPHSGTVYKTTTFGKGNILIIDGGSYKTELTHLHRYDVIAGQNVKAGDVIGEYGNTGFYTTGKHVHWELRKDGKLVDPMKHLNNSETNDTEYMYNFEDSIKNLYWDMLGRAVGDSEMKALMKSSRDKKAFDVQRGVLMGFESRREAIEQMYKRFTGKSGKKGYGKDYVDFQVKHGTEFSRISWDLMQNWKDYKKK